VEHGPASVHWTVGEHGPAREPETVLDPETAREHEQVEGGLVRLRWFWRSGCSWLSLLQRRACPVCWKVGTYLRFINRRRLDTPRSDVVRLPSTLRALL